MFRHAFTKSFALKWLAAISAAAVITAAACGGDGEAPAPTAAAEPTRAAATAAPQPTAQPTATTAPVAKPREPAGKLTIASPEVPPLIQHQRRDIAAVGGLGRSLSAWETLVKAPFVGPPNPPQQQSYSPDDLGLARSWQVAADGTSITFQIREKIPWHKTGGDWGTVTAEDVAWSFNEAFAPDSVNNGAEEIGVGMKKGFDVVDPLTVRMKIEPGGFDPTWAWLLGNSSFAGIVVTKKAAFDQLGPEKYAQTPIGTGKYRVLEWKASEKVVTEALTEHWTGIVPFVKSVTTVHMPEAATREAALRAGEIDSGELGPQVVNAVVKAIGGYVQEIGIARPQGFMPAGNYWSTQCSDCKDGAMPRPGFDEALAKKYPWVADPKDASSMERARKVRWAMAMAIDQESIIKNILNGLGRVIYAWENYLPGDPAHKPEWVIPYDPNKARQFMADAGYPSGFNMELWIPSTFPPGTVSAAEAAAEMWRKELKINATIDKTAYATRRPQTVDKTINVPFTHGINWIPGATSARYICPAAGHIVGLTMDDAQCAIGMSNATEKSLDKRIENNIKNQDYLSHWMLFIPMFQAPAILYAVGPRVAEWKPYNQLDVFFNNVETVKLK